MQAYEKGKIKVVWIEEDLSKIYSKMFDNEKEALKFAKNKEDYIIFALEHQNNMEQFSWRILPYGKHNLYLKALKAFKRSKGIAEKFIENFLESYF